jgi:hypothetical protein
MFVYTIVSFGTAFTGCGLLVGIPQTALFLFQIGLLARDYPLPVRVHQSTWKSANRIVHNSDTAAVQAS